MDPGPPGLAPRPGPPGAGAAPGGAPRDRFLRGLGHVARGARLVATDRALRRASLLPTALTLAGAAALAALLSAGERERFLESSLGLFAAVCSMPPTLLWPLWLRVGLEARRAAGGSPGEPERPGEPYGRTLLREGVKGVRQAALVAIGLLPVAGVVELVPGVGHAVTVALGAAWAWYWVVVDALEIPIELRPGKLGEAPPAWFERALGAAGARSRWLLPLSLAGRLSGRLARPWRHEAEFTERHRWESAGLAAAAVAFLAIPVAGVFFRAVAVTAATLLALDAEGAATAGEAASGPAGPAGPAAGAPAGRAPGTPPGRRA